MQDTGCSLVEVPNNCMSGMLEGGESMCHMKAGPQEFLWLSTIVYNQLTWVERKERKNTAEDNS